jgi:DNA-damage-inducible protein J
MKKIDGSEVLNMASTIQVRVEDELKSKSDALFKDLGTDTTTAIRMFLTQAVATNGFPFEIKRQIESNPYAPMTETEMLAKLEKSREQGVFRDADFVVPDMRLKYGI